MGRGKFLGVVLLALVGCSRESPQPSAPVAPVTAAPFTLEQARTRAQDIESRRAGWRSVPGTLQASDATSRFVALYDAGVLRLLDERSDFGDYGSGTARYYLDTTGTLFLYDARDERTVTDASRAGAREVVEVRMAFEPDGRMVASHKSVNGRVQPILKDEIDAIVAHFEALRKAAPAP